MRSTPARAVTTETRQPVVTLVGGVGELYQGDLDLGRRVAALLAEEDLGHGVEVEDLHYGAVAVAQHLQDLAPDTLILVGAVARDRPPATLERRRIAAVALADADLQVAVGDAVTGYVAIDLVIEVGAGLGALPDRVVTIEVEPVTSGPDDTLSPQVGALVPRVLDLVRTEVERAPVFSLAAHLVELVGDGHLEPSPSTESLMMLLETLGEADRSGHWGRSFSHRDELEQRLGRGETSPGMDHLDWGLVWSLIEELDRLEAWEAQRVAGS